MSDEDLVKNAANKYGFNLEFKTKDIFEKNGFFTEHNKLLKFNDELLEIDLIANKYPDRTFIVECKGMDSSSFLILVKESLGQEIVVSNLMSHDITGTNFRLVGYDESQTFCTFTGDFFNQSAKELKKSSRNDEENNFYKAQLQMIEAISAFSKKDNLGKSHIIPLIVTNTKIWVVDYNNPDKTEVANFKWVLHKVKLGTQLSLEPRLEKESDVLSFVLPVVNIKYLDEFLQIAQNMNVSTGRIKINSLAVKV